MESRGFYDLIRLAERNYKIFLLEEKEFPDECFVNDAAYQLQQGIEKLLKAIVLFMGETPEYTHNIRKLTQHCQRLNYNISDDLDAIADSLTLWESQTRYDPDVAVSLKNLEIAKRVYLQTYTQLVDKIQPVEATSFFSDESSDDNTTEE